MFAALYVLGAAATTSTGVIAWRRRTGTPAAITLVVFMASLTASCLTDLVVLLSNTGYLPPWLLVAAFTQIIPLAAVMPPSLWAMSQAVANHEWRPNRRTIAALSSGPVVASVAVALNGGDGPVLRVARAAGALWPSWRPGGLFWLLITIVSLAGGTPE
jgi:hypothetical protein